MPLSFSTAPDGTRFRDLNHTGTMEPYEDPRLSAEARTEDLLSRMTIEEKVGVMFHAIAPAGDDGSLVTGPTPAGNIDTRAFIQQRHINHLYTLDFSSPEVGAVWNNAVQDAAEETRLGIPVTISSDGRNSFSINPGAGMASKGFSMWPETLGLAALQDEGWVRSYANIARQEYIATGIRAALHPQVDLPTHPRWARQYNTLGVDPDLSSRLAVAYLEGFQRVPELGINSVACTTKHFPGGGAQKDGEDPHFVYGREQVYPGDRFEDHLMPFRAAISAGTSGIMPYYGMPMALTWQGIAVPEVGFCFNRVVIQDILRDALKFDGVVLTDFMVISDGAMMGRPTIGRAWGLEHLNYRQRVKALMDAGIDQIGGEHCTELLLDLIRLNEVEESRIDTSVRRILLVKFRLGLFDDPYVNVDTASEVVGREDFVRAAHLAQSRSVTVLTNHRATLPLPTAAKVVLFGVHPDAARARGFIVVETAAEADFALVRVSAPYTPRDEYALEAFFRAGTLTFAAELEETIAAFAAKVPTIVDVYLDRPAMLGRVVDSAAAVTVNWGTSDDAWLDVVAGLVAPAGRLPIEIPSSELAVSNALADVPAGTSDPLFELGYGLDISRNALD
jgi:beta-glucosidase